MVRQVVLLENLGKEAELPNDAGCDVGIIFK